MKVKPSVFCYVTPFASAASVKHAEKLLHCLSSTTRKLFFAGDERIHVINSSIPIEKLTLPTLHYLSSVHPKIYSLLLWLVHIIRGIFISTWFLIRKRSEIDIVICFLGLYYTPILLCTRLLGKCAISFEPTNDLVVMENAYGTRWWWRFLRFLSLVLRRINRTIANLIVIESFYVIEQGNLERYQRKVRQANLYVDIKSYRKIVPLDEREPVVGYLGRLSSEKGIKLILDAARLLAGTDYRFEIVGDGPLREYVENEIKLSDMSHVRYIGWLDTQHVPEFLNRIRLLVLPSVGEGLPNVVLEAMACSTPVLASPVGGIPDLIHHKETGFILTGETAQALSRAINDALAEPHLHEIGENAGKHVIENYSFKAAVCKWEKLFTGISKEE